MSLDLTYWTIAWVLMGVAFLTAFIAILVGSKNLDRQSLQREHDRNQND